MQTYKKLIRSIFPFYIIIDDDLNIIDKSRLAKKIFNLKDGDNITQHFALTNHNLKLEYKSIIENIEPSYHFQTNINKTAIKGGFTTLKKVKCYYIILHP